MIKIRNLNIPSVYIGLGAWLVYAELYLMAPTPKVAYNLDYSELFLLKLTITLPLLAIWMMAIYGVRRFRRYARIIKDSPDGQALSLVANGLAVAVCGFISQTIIGAVVPYTVGGFWLKPIVFSQNHLPLLLTLVGFSMILLGSLRLTRTVGLGLTRAYVILLLMPYAVLGLIFAWLFYSNFQLQVVNGIPNFSNGVVPSFWTIAVPFVISWLVGILAIANISEYARHVPGSIYRSALRDLASGISLTLLFSIVIQVISLSSRYFKHFALDTVLMIVYLLLALYAFSFVFIVRGAKKLTRIELSV